VARTEPQPLPAPIVRRELAYALSWATQEPSNESPWNYVRGLMRVGPAAAAVEAAAAGAAEAATEADGVEGGGAAPAAPSDSVPSSPGSSGDGALGPARLSEGGWRFHEYPELEAQLLAVRDEVG
jgi:hypothetical protein